jgi:hypothetical protein
MPSAPTEVANSKGSFLIVSSNVGLPAAVTVPALSFEAHYGALKRNRVILAVANFVTEALATSDAWTQP